MPKAQASVDADSTASAPVEPVLSTPNPKPQAETKPQVSAEADAGDTADAVPVTPAPKPKGKTVVKKDKEELPWLQHP
jgi:hypothetical protein